MPDHQIDKIVIAHPREKGVQFTGILEQAVDCPKDDHRLALIVHGLVGHKDNLHQKPLARQLPIHSFRYDLRGSHESTGVTESLHTDTDDLQVVYDHLTKKLGFIVEVIIAHSRGSMSSLLWMCKSPDSHRVNGFINISARSKMQYEAFMSDEQKEMLAERGFYYHKSIVKGKPIAVKITGRDHRTDLMEPSAHFPPATHVLTVQGLADSKTTPYDSVRISTVLSSRTPGTHNLCFVEGANHIYAGHVETLIAVILEWFSALEADRLTTGLWYTPLCPRSNL